MSTTDLLSGPVAQAIGLALLHTLWQGAIIAGTTAAVLALLSRRSAAVRYAIACGSLVLIFALTVITAVRSYTPRHDAGSMTIEATGSSALLTPEDSVVIAASAMPVSWSDRWSDAIASVRSHIPQIMMVWLAGVLILTLRLAGSWTRARALAHRGATAVDESWQRVAARLSEALGLRADVRLVISGGVDVPSVVGWLKPSILLPLSSFTGLTPEQLEMVLAHELAHIRRHDFFVNALQSVVETLLFYHPGVWYVSRQIRIERENCCDDLAVSVCGDAIQYARALAQLEELRATPVLAVAANGASLIERVRRLVGTNSERSLFSSGWTAVAAMASFVALLALTTAPMLAARRKAPQPPKPPATSVTVEAKAAAPAAKAEEPADPDANDDMDWQDVATPPVPAIAPTPMTAPTPMALPIPLVAPRIRVRPVIAIAGVTPEAITEGIDWSIDESDDEEKSSSPTPPGKLSIDELISLRVQGVTPEFIQQMRSLGWAELSLRDIIGFRVQGVTPEYVQKMRSIGFTELSARDVLSLRVQGVTPDYVAQLRNAGVQIKTARDAVSLKVQGVNPEFVKQLAAAGYDKLTVRDLVRLAATGVNADFIREMSKYKK